MLAIADPSLGGSRAGGVAKVAVLVGRRLGRGHAAAPAPGDAARAAHAPKVDVTTGLYTTSACLAGFLEHAWPTALDEHGR